MFYKIKSIIIGTFFNLLPIKINKNKYIFSSSFNEKYNYNSKYLFEYILKNRNDIEVKYVINNSKLREKLIEKYGPHFIETKSIKGILEVLKSGVWFTSAGLPIYGIGLNKKRQIINLWHGIPLKKIALLSNEEKKISKLIFRKIFSENYTYIFTTSKNLINIMSKSFGVDKEKIKVLGQPRNDVLFKSNEKVLKKIYNTEENSKKILYAPTFREKQKTILFPFKDLKLEDLNDFLEKNNIYIFIRMHQSEVDRKILKSYSRIKLISEDVVEDIMDVLNQFDMLITDYSSIYIDFLLLNRPEIFIPYDYDDYMKSRGLNFEYNQYTPGPKIKTQKELIDEILKYIENSKYFLEERIKANNYFNEIKEQCSENIINFVREAK